ncbi:MAG: FAD-binding oxidoreductase [Chloroflexi bacterium]|nr:FAD-binding oxidoreductase [Chloroflexota bacterium]
MASIVICGAGIAGISAAYFLAHNGARDIVLVDERAPLSLTSDKSTECYRNWWNDAAMVALMNRSIDLLDDLARARANVFHLNRRGYLYVTADKSRIAEFMRAGQQAESFGAGKLRVHSELDVGNWKLDVGERYVQHPTSNFQFPNTGADLILDRALIREQFPYLSERVVAVLHARRCGWLSAQTLGMDLLEQARARGVRFISARVESIAVRDNAVRGVRLSNGTTIATEIFVNAAGPFLKNVGQMLGIELPVFSELHQKISFADALGAIPRDAPMLIWSDPQHLEFSDAERALIAEADELRGLLAECPAGAHTRPEGGAGSTIALMLWAYHTPPVAEKFPLAFDPLYPQIVLRGMTTMLPALEKYFERPPKPILDGGYYTKTRENRPLIGALPVRGAFVIGALSGFGIMASCASGELLANYILGNSLPPYARAFAPERYDDPAYRAWIENQNESGQL